MKALLILFFTTILVISISGAGAQELPFMDTERQIAAQWQEEEEVVENRGIMQRIGGWAFGQSEAVAVDSIRNLLFLGSGGNVLVLDIQDPENPQLISNEIRTAGRVRDIEYDPSKELLFLALYEGDFDIWDVSQLNNISHVSNTIIYLGGFEMPVRTVEVKGDFAVLECYYGVVNVLNISDPAAPYKVFVTDLMGARSNDLYLDPDGYVHTTGEDGYRRFTLNGAGELIPAGGTGTGIGSFGYHTVFGNSQNIFFEYQTNIYILNSSNFQLVSSIDIPDGASDMVVRGNFIYIAQQDGFRVVDITNVQSPQQADSLVLPYNSYYTRVAVHQNYAYIPNGTGGLRVIDISDPYNVVPAGYFEYAGFSADVVVKDSLAYITGLQGGMFIVNINDPNHTELLSSMKTDAGAYDIEVDSSFAYIADWMGGFRVYDVSDPASPQEMAVFDSVDVWRTTASGDYAYFIEAIPNQPSYIWSLDISDKANPLPLDKLLMPDEANDLFLQGQYLYVAAENSGIRIIDVSDPANLNEVGSYVTPWAQDVFVAGNYAYALDFDYAGSATDFQGALIVLDVSDPTQPFLKGVYADFQFTAWDIFVVDDYAYVTEGSPNFTLWMFDVSDPAQPIHTDTFDLPGDAWNLYSFKSRIYVADGATGIQILQNSEMVGIGNSAQNSLPTEFALMPNYPNPFNPVTTISYRLPSRQQVKLEIFDLLGRKVRILQEGVQNGGFYRINWDGRNNAGQQVASGTYLYRLKAGKRVETRKMLLLR
ncbi:MAG: T9SS type A sorting domain-containing protein [Calditrichia bacterium]